MSSSAISFFATVTIMLFTCQSVRGFVPSLPTGSSRHGLLISQSQSQSQSHLISAWNTHARATTGAALFSSSSASTTGDSTNTTATSTNTLASTTTHLDRIIRLRGKVATGYGRGGKKLGFPTANLPASLFQDALQHVPTGVYFGWAWIENPSIDCSTTTTTTTTTSTPNGRGVAHKAAVNVGYSPTFVGKENAEKIIEAHFILNHFNKDAKDDDATTTTTTTTTSLDDFYGEFMRLLLVGYLRPELKFDSFPALMQAITTDVETANLALDQEPYLLFRSDAPFLSFGDGAAAAAAAATNVWIGKDGGNAEASWEFQDWNEAEEMLLSFDL